jgi:hypothetical protein
MRCQTPMFVLNFWGGVVGVVVVMYVEGVARSCLLTIFLVQAVIRLCVYSVVRDRANLFIDCRAKGNLSLLPQRQEEHKGSRRERC